VPPKRTMGPRSPRLGALGLAVEQVRKEAGLSQEDLGARCDLHGTHVSGLERGVRNPTYETLLRLASALDTSVGELTTRADRLYDNSLRRSRSAGK
jgi:transcriptional regulator with XRE-family HTH domain